MTTTSRDARVVVERMAQAAANFLASLAPDQAQQARFPFDDDAERRRWFYTPNARNGLTLGQMDPNQQRQAHKLVASGLSVAAYVTASTIIGLENTLDRTEDWEREWYPERGRDPGKYFVSIFGEPGSGDAWGWRFEGHHVSLQNTIVDGRVITPTPTFFGADPAEINFVGPGVLRPLAGEEDLGRELYHALDPEQRAVASISPAAPPDIVQSNRPQVEVGALPISAPKMMSLTPNPEWQALMDSDLAKLKISDVDYEALRYAAEPKGLAASKLSGEQRSILTALVHQYTDRMPDEVAEIERAKVTGERLDAIHFAWAGGSERRQPHYYRLQGPRFLVEYDNTQRDVNHIHSVWRDPEGDFGADLLAQHYAQAH